MEDIGGFVTWCSMAIFVLLKLRVTSVANCKGEKPVLLFIQNQGYGKHPIHLFYKHIKHKLSFFPFFL